MVFALLAYLTVKFAETLKAAKGAKLTIILMQKIPAQHAQQTVLFAPLRAVMNALLDFTIITAFVLHALLIV